MTITDRIFWAQNANSGLYNDGQYKVRLLNDKIVGVGDSVVIKLGNRNYVGKIKQVAGFGLKWDGDTISIQFSGKKNGKMIHINNIFDKFDV